jgi:hypothetical protein
MGLPFKKESMQDLTARFSSALKRIFDVEKMAVGGSDRPGNNRDNVFDFTDNTRMIISIDCYNDYLYLHISASNKDISSGQELFESIISKIVLLKIGDSSLGALPDNASVNITKAGVVHVLYELGKRKTRL